MTSSEIAALYGDRAMRLAEPIEFAGLYADVVLRRASFAGLEFIAYFQMSTATQRLTQVLLERQRQWATVQAWRAVIDALTQVFGTPAASCNQRGQPFACEPLLAVWPRLLLRYAPTRPGQPACQK